MSDSPSESIETPRQGEPKKAVLVGLVGLGAASAFWALFLWWQLLRSRAGFEPVCIGAGGCADLWGSPFAAWIHARTGLPVAAWGAVWGAVAAILPLQAMGQDQDEKGVPWLSAVRFTGLAGLVGVVGLLAVSAAAGTFCGSCAVTYLLSIVYGVLALRSLPGVPWTRGGLGTAAVAVLVAWGLFLYPGVRTPKNVLQESRQAFEEAAGATRVPDPVRTEKSVVPDDNPLKLGTWPLGEEERRRRLQERRAQAPEPWLGALSAVIDNYRKSTPASPMPTPRHLVGPAEADHRLTIFTDTQCGHCAQLHAGLEVLLQLFPDGAFHIDSRHFPLDGTCNPHIRPNPDRASCAAAKARICIEDKPGAWDLETELYRRQQELTEEMIFDILAPAMERTALAACMASPETAQRLEDDVAFAMAYDPHGTPVVLFDGKSWTQDPMMIYVMLLAGGDVDRPVFENLPEPPEDLHLH